MDKKNNADRLSIERYLNKENCFFEDMPEGLFSITLKGEPTIRLFNSKYLPQNIKGQSGGTAANSDDREES